MKTHIDRGLVIDLSPTSLSEYQNHLLVRAINFMGKPFIKVVCAKIVLIPGPWPHRDRGPATLIDNSTISLY